MCAMCRVVSHRRDAARRDDRHRRRKEEHHEEADGDEGLDEVAPPELLRRLEALVE